eukprot:GEZU01029578.1.p1 GENE.GEZU01029578.1~~GEZU01029578.1.p1  ORF type:complete len:123 (+),score=14.89 GEZU01029578.1:87-455(+)
MSSRILLAALCCALVILLSLSAVSAFKFDLDARSFKCFTEELPPKFEVHGEYAAAGGYSQFVDFRVTSPTGVAVINEKDINSGDFSFTTEEGGEYTFCFYNRLLPGKNLLLAVCVASEVIDR